MILAVESVDGPFNGPAPLPWNIPIYPDAFFQAHEKICEVCSRHSMFSIILLLIFNRHKVNTI